jgi:hypothetical protein
MAGDSCPVMAKKPKNASIIAALSELFLLITWTPGGRQWQGNNMPDDRSRRTLVPLRYSTLRRGQPAKGSIHRTSVPLRYRTPSDVHVASGSISLTSVRFKWRTQSSSCLPMARPLLGPAAEQTV